MPFAIDSAVLRMRPLPLIVCIVGVASIISTARITIPIMSSMSVKPRGVRRMAVQAQSPFLRIAQQFAGAVQPAGAPTVLRVTPALLTSRRYWNEPMPFAARPVASSW